MPVSAAGSGPQKISDLSGAFSQWIAPTFAANPWVIGVAATAASAVALWAIFSLIMSFVTKNSSKRWLKFLCTIVIALILVAPYVVLPLMLSLVDAIVNGVLSLLNQRGEGA